MIVNCYQCGKAMEEAIINTSGEVKGETFAVNTLGLRCPHCHYQTLNATQMDGYRKLLADAYRKGHGLLTSAEIKQKRAALSLSQQEFASFLNVGVASIKRWELGGVQEESMDQLLRLKCAERNTQATVQLSMKQIDAQIVRLQQARKALGKLGVVDAKRKRPPARTQISFPGAARTVRRRSKSA
jgi:putative zinc finger/helix-turn-helix YgiT family protein